MRSHFSKRNIRKLAIEQTRGGLPVSSGNADTLLGLPAGVPDYCFSLAFFIVSCGIIYSEQFSGQYLLDIQDLNSYS
jgi:hypothetical protein